METKFLDMIIKINMIKKQSCKFCKSCQKRFAPNLHDLHVLHG